MNILVVESKARFEELRDLATSENFKWKLQGWKEPDVYPALAFVDTTPDYRNGVQVAGLEWLTRRDLLRILLPNEHIINNHPFQLAQLIAEKNSEYEERQV